MRTANTEPKPTVELLKDAQRAIERETREVLQLEPGTPGSTDPCLYVNIGFNEALCISVQHFIARGIVYQVVAEAYDQTHGLEAEHWVGETRLDHLPALVKSFLNMQKEVD